MSQYTNEQFVNDVNNVIGDTIQFVEIEDSHFEFRFNTDYFKKTQSVYVSFGFGKYLEEMVEVKLNKKIKWDNLGLKFWLEDID